MKHGDRVMISAVLKRISEKRGLEPWAVWRSYPRSDSGIFLGYRTLANGVFKFTIEGYENREYIKTALVSLNNKENPVYVPLDYITPFICPCCGNGGY